MTKNRHPGRPTRLDEVFSNYESPLFFVTFNTLGRQSILANSEVHKAFRQYARRGVDLKAVVVGRYVIMPDHIHLFVHPVQIKLGEWIKGLKRAISEAIIEREKQKSTWQPGFFDHLLRNDESYEQKWEYVRMNPVRAGLVERSEDWPYQGEIVRIERL